MDFADIDADHFMDPFQDKRERIVTAGTLKMDRALTPLSERTEFL
jgi:hypothetical protein